MLRSFNLLMNRRLKRIEQKAESVATWVDRLEKERHAGETHALHLRRSRSQADLPEALRRESRGIRDEVFYRVVFKGYLERELKQIEKLKHIDKIRVPKEF